ncbi:DUF938 domain-containing protein [Rhodobacteraceae bacterium B1Z28]|uniref:DUF938 domain-containing protein n=1 Tax=Ruegeria haliotis TaxID=2747601 RepID=A0ABX2PJK9_9RHOB|nr:DUF938 domain-containing protein [Ruegeria haliotis]NVO54300.1 DUF938 domain-containing protein [Ruegeria haliotis]
MIKRIPPSSASVASAADNGKMVAPAASRNSDVLCELLQDWAPRQGRALEIASGTGQHVCAFAGHLPNLTWQPTEINSERRASIDAYAANLPNIARAAELDATSGGWHSQFAPLDLVVLVNLLHLVSWDETETLVSEVAQALSPKGRFILYGPFKRAGHLTSDGDRRFHEALILQDPEIGYKNDDSIADLMSAQGLDVIDVIEMPANNLAFIAEARAT